MRIALPLIAAASLAACSTQPASDVANIVDDRTETVPPAAPPEPIAAHTPEAAARYVGRWAANKGLCGNGAWKFEPWHLSTAGEVSCDFRTVSEVPGGYDVAARCLAEGNRSDETIKLRFAESAGAMLVESKTFRPIGLIRCA